MEQSSLAEQPPVPTRKQLSDAFDVDVSDAAYRDYYAPVLRVLYSLSPGEKIGVERLYQSIDRDVATNTKWDYITDVLAYEPRFAERIADRAPPADVFLEVGVRRAGLGGREEVDAASINRVQAECEAFAVELRKSRAEALVPKAEARQAALEDVGGQPHDDEDLGTALDVFYEHLLDEPLKIAKDVERFNQGLLPVAGEANELLFVATLENQGLQSPRHYRKVSDDGPHDVEVYAPNAPPLNVEIKSIALRERGDAGVARIEDPAVLAGFFDDPAELRSHAAQLRESCTAVYAPPETVVDLPAAGGMNDECGAGAFFRANNRFATDMRHYAATGRLPPADPRHARAFVSEE